MRRAFRVNILIRPNNFLSEFCSTLCALIISNVNILWKLMIVDNVLKNAVFVYLVRALYPFEASAAANCAVPRSMRAYIGIYRVNVVNFGCGDCGIDETNAGDIREFTEDLDYQSQSFL